MESIIYVGMDVHKDTEGKSDNYIENKCVIADTGYFSEDNLTAAQENKIDAFIPDQNFRKRDVRFETKRRHVHHSEDSFVHDDFSYDTEKDVVVCPAGVIIRYLSPLTNLTLLRR